MRDIMERFLVLPFSMGCMSKSNAAGAVESSQCKEQKPQPKQLVTRMQEGKSSSGMKLKNSWGLVALRRSNISRGFRKLVLETLESFSRILSYKDVEEIELELEIGLPTDVKHVTHIGYDGSMTRNPVKNKNWDNMETPEIHSFPCISMKQFEHAMAAQSQTPPPPNHSTNDKDYTS
ncbi:CRIB domain-containing protein RIC4-like [Cynara cardunculus var. scolymus]|uniref:PAK-box/P21-Rho-binding n=1 Tax=Cynara cardunculus var. scolymus TaxID=59895 RepID=A0A118K4Z2_CYNCS|nr:CRIB domain-containing protein RIC4-like [Cynara cardunculus var. scolymus]KVI08280.1 PAK-box/P21-Rho-binding [Cynara cardunculus var. scolymus]